MAGVFYVSYTGQRQL